jgi:hypothetical protein
MKKLTANQKKMIVDLRTGPQERDRYHFKTFWSLHDRGLVYARDGFIHLWPDDPPGSLEFYKSKKEGDVYCLNKAVWFLLKSGCMHQMHSTEMGKLDIPFRLG